MTARPPLSVVIPAREGLAEVGSVLEALLPQAKRTGAEVLVVGPPNGPAPEGVRLLELEDDDIFRLRMAGLEQARGEIVAIGEDHAVPRPDWCEAVLRAHAERPEIPAIAGCLANATDRRASARGNFFAFAAPFAPPMPALPAERPPPVSALSLKRSVLEEASESLGHFETVIVPGLLREGRMAADDRIVVEHYQDLGLLETLAAGFHAARGGYGYLRQRQTPRQRLGQARWALLNWPRRTIRDARPAARGADLAVVALYGVAVGLGGAFGALAGPGRSPARIA
jgi:hypothetical protein